MIKAKVKFDDKDILKEIGKKTAHLFVGYTDKNWYEAVDTPFYANVPKKNTLTLTDNVGKPRRFSKQEAKASSDVAAFNEFGGGHTPPRPFLSYCLKKNARKWNKFVQDHLAWDSDPMVTFHRLGDVVKGDIEQTVLGWSQPPNAPSTVKNKGFNNPLVDSGNMSSDFIEIEVTR